MLLGLDPVLSPDLLHTLAAMGHGDRIVLVDANYPATRGRRLIQLPGIAARPAGRAVGVSDRHLHPRAVRRHADRG
jgi:L-fucose mutarotase